MSRNKILEYLKENKCATSINISNYLKSPKKKIENTLFKLKKEGEVHSQDILNQYQTPTTTFYFYKNNGMIPPEKHICKNNIVCEDICKKCAYYSTCFEINKNNLLKYKRDILSI